MATSRNDVVLALDPSSTRTGYAVMRSITELLGAGYLRPARREDPPLVRIDQMSKDLHALIYECQPSVAVIEVPSGRSRAGLRANQGGYLAIYGMAVGDLRRTAIWTHGESVRVVSVSEREWTRGRGRNLTKRERRAEVIALFPQLAAAIAERDSGGDVSDAIGIGLWWFRCGYKSLRKACDEGK